MSGIESSVPPFDRLRANGLRLVEIGVLDAPISGLRSPISDPRPPVSDLRSPTSGLQCLQAAAACDSRGGAVGKARGVGEFGVMSSELGDQTSGLTIHDLTTHDLTIHYSPFTT